MTWSSTSVLSTYPARMRSRVTAAAHALSFSNGRLEFGRLEVNSYLAAIALEYLSQRLLAQAKSIRVRP